MVTQSRKLDPGWLPQSVDALSHFLGISSFQEIEKKSRYSKIIACCEQAKRDNLHYVWVDLLGSITGISSGYTKGTEDTRNASVAQRMSWTSKRQTTRKEDVAYSLIGIFDVNMPLLYGEGDKAFLRVHEEIVRQSEDHSYLAWGFQMPLVCNFHGLFTQSPGGVCRLCRRTS